jgi:APA family basic amino acid/polyamine antiporter
LLPLVLFVVVGFFFVDTGRYALTARPIFGDFSVSVLLLVYAFSGFETAAIPSGEARNPRRDLPWALIMTIGVVTVFYFLIQLIAIGTLPGLAESTRPLADAGERFLGSLGATIMSAGALFSIFGNLNVTLMVTPRLPFAMAERRELPRFIGATHARFHTPHIAIYLTGLVVLALTLTGTFVYAATISVIARLLSYGATCAALPVLRGRENSPRAEFIAPFGVAVSVLSLLLVAGLTQSTAVQARDAATAAAIGLLIYFLSQGKTGRAG